MTQTFEEIVDNLLESVEYWRNEYENTAWWRFRERQRCFRIWMSCTEKLLDAERARLKAMLAAR